MPTIQIDGEGYEFTPGMTIIQVADQNGIEIPRFCYHERLNIAGNCRMCLVEVKGGPPKPAASCAMPAADKMEVFTKTPMVKKAREGVMEFLLINHPLDCPICDQGGECDLQDQALFYGKGESRYRELKRAVEDKYMGPLIETHMTRCIHCTRCVRFISDVAGVPEIGGMGRGEHMEITTYVEKAIASELSGNIVDLCPVGALTSKPYSFVARPWELTKTESIDVMDAVGSNIRVDARGNAVLRVLPRMNDLVNEEWISDKTRHACDGLRLQRLDRPYVRDNGALRPASWEEAFVRISNAIAAAKPERIAALAGDLVDLESMVALKDLMTALGSANIDCRQDGAALNAADRASWLFNTTIAGIEQADAILLIGADPRFEAPLVNSRIRKRFLRGGLTVFNLGADVDLTYPTVRLGNDPASLSDLRHARENAFTALANAKYPMIILGMGALTRLDGAAILSAAKALAESANVVRADWNGFNILHKAAARVGGMEIGFVPGQGGKDARAIVDAAATGQIDVLYALGVDEIATPFSDAFVIYQGHHGDRGAAAADVVLPGVAYTEKDATYVNLEGRPQRAFKAVSGPGESKEDWRILRALSAQLGHTLPYDTLGQLRERIAKEWPHLARMGEVTLASWTGAGQASGPIDSAPFTSTVANFYQTDPISRVSKTMAECTRLVWSQIEAAASEREAA